MSDDNRFDAIRGWVGNALLWGAGLAALAALAVVAFGVLSVVGVIQGGVSLMEAFILVTRFGIVGFVAGGAFSLAIRLLYRGRRLSDIDWVRFGIVGGMVTGVFVPLFLQTMNLLSGDGLVPWGLVLDDALMMAVFGTFVAGGSLKISQIADKLLLRAAEEPTDFLENGGALALEDGLDAE